MIRPTKYMQVQTCSLRVAAVILAKTRRLSAIPLAEIEDSVAHALGEPARVNVHPAINLLYLLGAIKYDSDADALVYLSADERPEK